jgi:hypothetical protein
MTSPVRICTRVLNVCSPGAAVSTPPPPRALNIPPLPVYKTRKRVLLVPLPTNRARHLTTTPSIGETDE